MRSAHRKFPRNSLNGTDGDDGNLEMYTKKAKRGKNDSFYGVLRLAGSGRVAQNSFVIRVYPLRIPVVKVIFSYKNTS